MSTLRLDEQDRALLRGGRGSSSASTPLAEAIRLETAPSAIILREIDEILTVAAMVARMLYAIICPIVVLAPSDYDRIVDGDEVRIDADGVVTFSRSV